MSARRRRCRELRYEFGFRPSSGDLVVCSSLEEARFFASNGARLVYREIETRVGEWTEVATNFGGAA